MARITICLPVYNGAEHVGDALASIAAQTSNDYVVIASDNASTDQTSEILMRWAKKIPMEVITQKKTIPMQEHFNVLLDQIKSESYMLLCHDDYFYSPHAVAKALDVLDNQPQISAIYCDLAYVSEKGRTLAHRRFGRSGEIEANSIARQSFRKARNMFGIPLLIRRDALGTNRYDLQFQYVIDIDLSWTVSKHAPAWHIPEVLIANRYRRGNSTWTMISDAESEFFLMARKHAIQFSPAEQLRMRMTNLRVAQQKRLFGVYERVVTWLG